MTVTRSPEGQPWATLRIPAIAEHLQSGAPAVVAEALADTVSLRATGLMDDDIDAEIRSVLGLWVRPGFARDGGDIVFDRFDPDTGVLWIRMHGACGGCPSSRSTLTAGVERIVRRCVTEVLSVEETASQAPLPRDRARFAGGGRRALGLVA